MTAYHVDLGDRRPLTVHADGIEVSETGALIVLLRDHPAPAALTVVALIAPRAWRYVWRGDVPGFGPEPDPEPVSAAPLLAQLPAVEADQARRDAVAARLAALDHEA